MILCNTTIPIFLGLYALVCLSTRQSDFTENLKNYKSSSTCCNQADLPLTCYVINLYEASDEAQTNLFEDSTRKYFSIDFRNITFDINDKEKVDYVVESLQGKENQNFEITFIFKSSKLKLIKFIKSFIRKLEENNIDKVEIKYNYGEGNESFYKPDVFYLELYNDHLSVLSREHTIYGSTNLEKKVINKNSITDLIQDNSELYFELSHDENEKKVIQDFFLNYRLVFLDKDTLVEESKLLENSNLEKIHFDFTNEKYKKGDVPLPDMKVLYMFFYFYQGSYSFKSKIEYFLNYPDRKNNVILGVILKFLKIDFVNSPHILVENTGNYLLEASQIINKYSDLADYICDKISMLKVENDLVNYKRLLSYFYYCLLDTEDLEILEIARILDEFIMKKEFKEQNKIILKELVQHFATICRYYNYKFYNDVYDEKEDFFV